MQPVKRIFLIVLDSFGVGEAPDAADFGDQGSDTLGAVSHSPYFDLPNLDRLGLFCLDGVTCRPGCALPIGSFARLTEASRGKDTTIGHWELAGLISPRPLPTFPNGFPPEVLGPFMQRTGRGVLCNRPYSGTQVIRDYGGEHLKTGDLIVYTSADSVFQIAAHESIVPPETLYAYCRAARDILQGPYGVGRVIARPFEGEWPFSRTVRRHDFSLAPPSDTMLDVMKRAGFDVLAVGKIHDIFAGRGDTAHVFTSGNEEGIARLLELTRRPFRGLCFVNLVDFDMLYGHRNDVDGYAKALSVFDRALPQILANLEEGDVLMITADHGCDPATPSTDHSREYTPWLLAGPQVRAGVNLGTLPTFADVSATVLDAFGLPPLAGTSHAEKLFL